jgi:dTDP-4-amino-4,6-dideoxy-D-galactose acyltransferase
MSYRPLPWDSEFFGFPIGRLDAEAARSEASLRAATSEADGDAIRCLYLLLDSQDVSGLQRAIACGFMPVDIRVELELALEPPDPALSAAPGIRPAVEADISALEQLARQTMRETRFLVDPGFPANRASELYSAWARRGVLGAPLHRALITEETDAGFIICGVDATTRAGAIELIGVATGQARRGIGRALVRTAGALFVTEGCTRASVVTQGRNVMALRLYEACGYRTSDVGWWLHRWR